jgi:hypothetical protein
VDRGSGDVKKVVEWPIADSGEGSSAGITAQARDCEMGSALNDIGGSKAVMITGGLDM